MVKDSISDFLAKLSNAGKSGKPSVIFPQSNVIQAISECLNKEGFVSSVEKKGKKNKKFLEVGVSYNGKIPKINKIQRISKPSRRIYEKASRLRSVRNGFGRIILSTPKGILSGENAKKEKVGGELLFKIW
jgi:small subunit ribosomal protein S8